MSRGGAADTTARGAQAEAQAQRHLQARGLRLVARNWRCAGGELDLVMRDGATLVMVEVRRRSRSDYGGGFESVHARKRARLVHAAGLFLAAHPEYAEAPVRFDVVAIDGIDGDAAPEWLAGAFDADN